MRLGGRAKAWISSPGPRFYKPVCVRLPTCTVLCLTHKSYSAPTHVSKLDILGLIELEPMIGMFMEQCDKLYLCLQDGGSGWHALLVSLTFTRTSSCLINTHQPDGVEVTEKDTCVSTYTWTLRRLRRLVKSTQALHVKTVNAAHMAKVRKEMTRAQIDANRKSLKETSTLPAILRAARERMTTTDLKKYDDHLGSTDTIDLNIPAIPIAEPEYHIDDNGNQLYTPCPASSHEIEEYLR